MQQEMLKTKQEKPLDLDHHHYDYKEHHSSAFADLKPMFNEIKTHHSCANIFMDEGQVEP